jgi:preprotein translocase subunit SecY
MKRLERHIFKYRSLYKKLLISLLVIVIYKLGSYIPAPNVNVSAVKQCGDFVKENRNIAGLYVLNVFSGGALSQLSILALGLSPYITASIIIQLLSSVIPKLKLLKEEGSSGQSKINQYTRYLTLVLASLQASGTTVIVRNNPDRLFPGCSRFELMPQNMSIYQTILTIVAMVTGSMITLWLAELITNSGISNGISLLVFVSVASQLPYLLYNVKGVMNNAFKFSILLLGVALLFALILFVESSFRKLYVYYARQTNTLKSSTARGLSILKNYTYMPLKLNQSGIVPIILASSLIYFPIIVVQLLDPDSGHKTSRWILLHLSRTDKPIYMTVYSLLILFFSFFYLATTFNSELFSKNIEQQKGFIPGVHPGAKTSSYIMRTVLRLNIFGSLYLVAISILPIIGVNQLAHTNTLFLAGTSVLIIVNVGMESLNAIKSHIYEESLVYKIFR